MYSFTWSFLASYVDLINQGLLYLALDPIMDQSILTHMQYCFDDSTLLDL